MGTMIMFAALSE